jgi:DHA2 family multidrug resistance protein
VFFEAIPLCAVAALLAWYGLPQEPPRYERFRMFDWRGALLAFIGFASLTTMLQQGDRLDWFNSRPICFLAFVSAVSIPLLLVNEWFHPLPLLKLQMLSRRNFLYGVIALFTLLIIGLSAGKIPLTYLQEIQGYRPLQSYSIVLEIALLQLVMLPLVAFVLDFACVDARVVSAVGLGCILVACLGGSSVTATWNREQFYLWQALQAIGQPLLIVPLLMIATNSVAPQEGPFASALVNTPRSLAEATSVWLFQLAMRWRGGLHADRLLDQAGQSRFQVIQAKGLLPNLPPPLLPSGLPRAHGSLGHFAEEIARQATVLSLGDAFLIMGALTTGLMLVLLILPVRTYPPRIQLARK